MRPFAQPARTVRALVVVFAIASGNSSAHAESTSAPSNPGSPSPGHASPWLARVMDEDDRRHLLMRTGLGVAPADLLALDGLTRAEGVDWIVDGLRVEPFRAMPPFTQRPPPRRHARASFDDEQRQRYRRARDGELAELRRWWASEMLATPSPQTERLVLLWHDLVPSAYSGTDRATLALARQNALFRRLQSQKWDVLLKALLRDAALLDYLDANRNRRAAPNENLAREFLELFTLGEGHYAESDVREAARALTGLSVADMRDLTFRLESWHQDRGQKTLFGRRDTFDADGLVDAVLDQPAAARHLARVYWHAFISDAAPPGPELKALANAFRASGHSLLTLYRSVLVSEAFWSVDHRAAIVRSPIDLLTGLARSLEYPKRHAHRLPALQDSLGLALFEPPNVAGWQEGGAWVTPGRLLARYAAVASLVDAPDAVAGAQSSDAMSMSPGMSSDMAPDMAPDMSPDMAPDSSMSSGDAPLALRIASDRYRGDAEIVVSLRIGRRTLWQVGPLALRGGHDTERFGRSGGGANLPWETLAFTPPADLVEAADAVRIRFVNDAAGPDGDRNVYVDRVRAGTREGFAYDGTQRSDCVPEAAAAAGDLYCAGHVSIPLSARRAPLETPEPNASALHLRWANLKPDGRVAATLVLDDPAFDGWSASHVQFELVAEPDGVPELRVDSFGCLDGCVRAWPDCAWTDPHHAPMRALAVPLLETDRDAYDCFAAGLGARDRTWLGTLADAVPEMLARLLSRDDPRADRHRDALDALHARVLAHRADVGADDGLAPAIIIDAALAPPTASDAPVPAMHPGVGSIDELARALAPMGIDPVSLLWPGLPLPEGLQQLDEPVAQRLDAVLAHPGFQLK